MIYVFSYQREEMLDHVLKDIQGEDHLIIDDGSDFERPNMIKFTHGGKRMFWERWNYALRHAKRCEDELFIFMPNDFLNIDLETIRKYHEELKDNPYVFNIINDGRAEQWIRFKAIDKGDKIRVGFTDCGFFCNRKTLDLIGYHMERVSDKWFRRAGSSGVGHQLTKRLHNHGVPIYKPLKSLAYHGDHPSTMHENERLKNPLISI